MSKKTITKVCETCGSENIVRDAPVRWDVAAQRWQMTDVYDGAHCEDCQADCEIADKVNDS